MNIIAARTSVAIEFATNSGVIMVRCLCVSAALGRPEGPPRFAPTQRNALPGHMFPANLNSF
jgi:hypothetical protein